METWAGSPGRPRAVTRLRPRQRVARRGEVFAALAADPAAQPRRRSSIRQGGRCQWERYGTRPKLLPTPHVAAWDMTVKLDQAGTGRIWVAGQVLKFRPGPVLASGTTS
jgi:hypothetical protein